MELQNYVTNGAAGRVASWIEEKKEALLEVLQRGVEQYIKDNTEPYVLDNTTKTVSVVFHMPDSLSENGIAVFRIETQPLVPCMQKLLDKRAGCVFFPLSLLEEHFQPYVNLLKRLIACQNSYIEANQKMKKAIFQTLFSEDDQELNDILEDVI